MKKHFYEIITGLVLLFGFGGVVFGAQSAFTVFQGGTGSTTPSGILIGDNGATPRLSTLTIGTNLTLTGTTLSAAGGSGTYPFTPSTFGGGTMVTSATSTALQDNIALYVSSTTDPITNMGGTSGVQGPTGSGGWPVVIANPQSVTGQSTGIGFSISSSPGVVLGGGIGFQRQGANGFGDLFFSTTPAGGFNTERLRITSTGNVGIGSTSPYALLSLHATSTGSIPNNKLFAIGSSTANSTTTLFTIDNTGTSTLLGTASSTNVNISGVASCSGTNALTTNASGIVGCGAITGSGGAFPFTPSAIGNSTSTLLLLTGGASTTLLSVHTKAYFGGTSTTTIDSAGSVVLPSAATLTLGGITDKTLNTDVNGKVYGIATGTVTATSPITLDSSVRQVIGGSLAISCASCATFGYPFTPTNNFNVVTSATSSTVLLTAGLHASTTVRFGNAGLPGQFVWDSAFGGLALGTTTPGSTLAVSSSTAPQLMLTDASVTSFPWTFRNAGGNLYLATSSLSTYSTSTIPAFTILANDNVGIGSSSPYAEFSLHQSTGEAQNLNLFAIGSSTATATSTLFVVRNDGNVGIGTSTPKWPLSIANATIPQITLMDGGNTAPPWGFYSIGGNLLIGTSSPTTFATSSNTALTIIGNASPSLAIGSSSPNGNLVLEQNAETNSVWIANQGSSTPSFVIKGVNGDGNVGVGTTTPWRDFSVSGTVAMQGLTSSGSSQAGDLCISASNDVVNDSVACIVSARRFKEKITPLHVGLDEVLKFSPVSFFFKPDFNGALQSNPNFNGMQYSLIADDVQKIDPHLVSVSTGETTFEGVTYPAGTVQGLASLNNWIGLFVAAFQDVETQIQSVVARLSGLESRVNAQDKKIKELETRLKALETK